MQQDDGSYSGFDVDLCRAVAAAIFSPNDSGKSADDYINYDFVDPTDRFTPLANKNYDMLAAITTFTMERDVKIWVLTIKAF